MRTSARSDGIVVNGSNWKAKRDKSEKRGRRFSHCGAPVQPHRCFQADAGNHGDISDIPLKHVFARALLLDKHSEKVAGQEPLLKVPRVIKILNKRAHFRQTTA
jgi:hypothetical protein